MSATVIQDILNNGRAINNNLGKKIELLNARNTSFNQELTKRLNDIITAIDAFKSTNLQGLTETKNKLAAVTTELETTKQNLEQTQAELNRVKQESANIQNELQTTNARKNELEQQVRDLEQRIQDIDTEYKNKINGVRQEMADKATKEKKDMQTEFDNQIAALNNEKAQLQNDINNAKQAQTDAVNKLADLQKEQDGLIENLGTINAFLAQQLNLIDSIKTEEPDIGNFTDLLDSIQQGLTGVITGINSAVATNVNPQKGAYNIEANMEKLRQLRSNPDKYKYTSFIKDVRGLGLRQEAQTIEDNIDNFDKGKESAKQTIKTILEQNEIPVPPYEKKGGKRRRKTMKKRNRRTRKKMRGGYVWKEDDKLKNSSSVISESSGSKSRSGSKSKSKKYRHRHSRRS
jgi:chromosome segregation ATPase